MFDISEDLLSVSLIQINTIAGRQILLVKITIARPCLGGNKYDVSQDVRQLVTGRQPDPRLRPAFRPSFRTR